jgi:hypothetical protein
MCGDQIRLELEPLMRFHDRSSSDPLEANRSAVITAVALMTGTDVRET